MLTNDFLYLLGICGSGALLGSSFNVLLFDDDDVRESNRKLFKEAAISVVGAAWVCFILFLLKYNTETLGITSALVSFGGSWGAKLIRSTYRKRAKAESEKFTKQ